MPRCTLPCRPHALFCVCPACWARCCLSPHAPVPPDVTPAAQPACLQILQPCDLGGQTSVRPVVLHPLFLSLSLSPSLSSLTFALPRAHPAPLQVFEEIYDYYARGEAWNLSPGAVESLERIRAAGELAAGCMCTAWVPVANVAFWLFGGPWGRQAGSGGSACPQQAQHDRQGDVGLAGHS